MSEALDRVVEGGSFNPTYEGELWYDGVRRLVDLPLLDMRLTEDDTRAVKSTGSCQIVWTDDMGESIAPREIGDVFSPFGSEIAVYAVLSLGGYTERIPMGWFQITDVPEMRDETMFWQGRTITTGTTLSLDLQDRFVQVLNDEFDVPTAPTNLTSVWSEIGRITGLQLIRSIDDAPISRSVAYKDSVSEAVLDLADILGGIPYITRDGALSMRSKVWPAPVGTLRMGEGGQIINIGKAMSSDGVYNRVVFRGQGAQQDQVLSVSEVTSGPLRVKNPDGSRAPAHRRPTFRSNQFVTTRAQAQAYTDNELARVRTLNAQKWPITMTWDPRQEVGQVWNVVDEHNETSVTRIISIDRDTGPTQKVVVVRG
jgi:hypothetical protein